MKKEVKFTTHSVIEMRLFKTEEVASWQIFTSRYGTVTAGLDEAHFANEVLLSIRGFWTWLFAILIGSNAYINWEVEKKRLRSDRASITYTSVLSIFLLLFLSSMFAYFLWIEFQTVPSQMTTYGASRSEQGGWWSTVWHPSSSWKKIQKRTSHSKLDPSAPSLN